MYAPLPSQLGIYYEITLCGCFSSMAESVLLQKLPFLLLFFTPTIPCLLLCKKKKIIFPLPFWVLS